MQENNIVNNIVVIVNNIIYIANNMVYNFVGIVQRTVFWKCSEIFSSHIFRRMLNRSLTPEKVKTWNLGQIYEIKLWMIGQQHINGYFE